MSQHTLTTSAHSQTPSMHCRERESFKFFHVSCPYITIFLFRQTGLLLIGPKNSHNFQKLKNTLERNKVPMELLNHDNFSQHIPNMNLAEGHEAVMDRTAGVLYADRALKTVQVQQRHCYYSLQYVSFRNLRHDSRQITWFTNQNYVCAL